MHVPVLVWWLTVIGIVGLLLFDYFFHVRKAHVPTLREAAVWSAVYVGIAILFGLGVLALRRLRRWARSTSPATSPRRRCRSTTCSSS